MPRRTQTAPYLAREAAAGRRALRELQGPQEQAEQREQEEQEGL